MDIVYFWRTAYLAVLLLFLAACAPHQPAPLPSASLPAAHVVVALPAVLAEPQRWSGQELTVISPVYDDGEHRLLAVPLPRNAASIDKTEGIWLAQPLPTEVGEQLAGGKTIAKLHGVLSPPGAYGREQRFAYQFVADRVTSLTPERTTIANLALNPAALDQILLQLQGTLLVNPDAALLVDEVGAGGVPKASGHQIKLSREGLDPALVASFTEAGNVRWGNVAVVGWWQNGTLTPLIITTDGGSAPASATATPSSSTQP